MKCPNCGKNIPDDSKFCLECGSGISAVSKQSGIEGLSLGEIETMMGKRASAMPVNPTVREPLSDRYELLEEIGRGGFAVVYKATDRKLGRIVAIKRLLQDENEVSSVTLERFKREARVIAGLNHRNVVAVYDVGEDSDGIYLVMEYIESGNLHDLMLEKNKFPLIEAISLMRGMVQGLSYAHRKNLVHRDIKPANILLKREGRELVPKIVDFGLAQAGRESELSISGYGMGTPWYMPPEQRRDAKNVNHTADIYALGKVLYELVSGEIPDNVDPDLIPPPKGLSDIIFKCIKSKPEERFFSADELLEALEALEDGTLPKKRGPQQRASEGACPTCGSENPLDVRFCEQCGGGLYRSCPECGRENRTVKQFCGFCGTDVDGFAAAVEVMGRMEKYAEEKKWTRMIKEYELLGRDVRMPGERGQKLVATLEEEKATADRKLELRNALKEQIFSMKDRDDRVERAISLIADYEKVDPYSSEMNELAEELRKKMDQVDYKKASDDARKADIKGQSELAVGYLRSYLAKHPEGQYVEAVQSLLDEQMMPKVANQIRLKKRRVVRSWIIAVLLVCLSVGGFFGYRFGKVEYDNRTMIKEFERAAKYKDVDRIKEIEPNLPADYDSKPVIMELGGFEQARQEFSKSEQLVGEYINSGDEDGEALAEVLSKIERPNGLAEGAALYREASRLCNTIYSRNEEWYKNLERLNESKGGVSDEEYEKYVPELWEEVSAVSRKANDSSLDLADRIRHCRQASEMARTAHEEYVRQVEYEKGIQQARGAVKELTENSSAEDYANYVPAEWQAFSVAKEKAEAEADRSKALPLWQETAEHARVANTRCLELQDAENKMLLSKKLLLNACSDLARKYGWAEFESMKKDNSVPSYLIDAMATEFADTGAWDGIISGAKLAEKKESDRLFAEANTAYAEATRRLFEITSASTGLQTRQQRYDSYVQVAKDAEKQEDWNEAYTALEMAMKTGVDNTSEAQRMLNTLDNRLHTANKLRRIYESKVEQIGADLLEKHCKARWAIVQGLASQGFDGKKDQMEQTYGMAIANLEEIAVCVYSREAVLAMDKKEWKVCREYYAKAEKLKKVAQSGRAHPDTVADWNKLCEMYWRLPRLEESKDWKVELDYHTTIVFKSVPKDTFKMGTGLFGPKEEKPGHKVTFSRACWVAETEVTQAVYRKVMGANPSAVKKDRLPVENVTWKQAMEFCRKLTKLEHDSGHLSEEYIYTLPTEAQWEAACRGGEGGKFSGDLKKMGWYSENSGIQTRQVGIKKANAYGLFDMHGNVREWCLDGWHDNYKNAPTDGSEFRGGDVSRRVVRGGSYADNEDYCRSSARVPQTATTPKNITGFRPVVVKK